MPELARFILATGLRLGEALGVCERRRHGARVRLGAFDGPVFADSKAGYRDNGSRAFREVRAGTGFDWVKPHTYRKTVATLLDGSGATARMIADQLGHSRVSMTQDVYLGRRSVDPSVAQALEGFDPDAVQSARPSGGE